MTLSFPIDLRMLAFAVAVSCAVALLFGLAPAFAATRLDRTPMFRGSSSLRADTPHATRSGTMLVVAQVAISCVLLSVALLFARSLNNLSQLDAGFERENILVLSVGINKGGPTGSETARLYGRVLEHLATVPGVRSAALSSETLFGGGRWTEAINTPEFNPVPGQNRDAVMLVVSPNFFRTMGTRLLAGRDFNSRDIDEGHYSCYAGAVVFVSTPSGLVRFGKATPIVTLMQTRHCRIAPEVLWLVSGEPTGYGLVWYLKTVTQACKQPRAIGLAGSHWAARRFH